jgi:hypothetical protein
MLEALDMDYDDVDGELWFQQDGATAYASREPVDCLSVMFP